MSILPFVRPIHFRCAPVLPLVYDDALSYYEVLCKFSQKINEVIDRYNKQSLDYESALNAAVDGLQRYIDAENQRQDAANAAALEDMAFQIKLMKEWQQAEMKIFEQHINEVIQIMESWINVQLARVYDRILAGESQIRFYIDQKIDGLKEWVINQNITGIQIRNPITGEVDTLQTVLDMMYSCLRYGGITAKNFDGANLTCTQFEDLRLTCCEFDVYGKYHIEKSYYHYIFDPISGVYDKLPWVLYRWFTVYRTKAITAQQFSSAGTTAQSFDDIEMDALEFDEEATTFIVA